MNKSIALIISNPNIIHQHDLTEIIQIMNESGYEVYVSERFKDLMCERYTSLHFLSDDSYYKKCSLAFSLGGDGSMIEAARLTHPLNILLAGINFGRLGYLTTLEKNEFDELRKILSGEYTVEQRSLLAVSVLRNNQTISMPNLALNEVLLANAPMTKMLTFDLLCDGILTQNIKADGIVISTPSGSTGYSLSAGGPVVSPSLNCMIATPLCPHSLSSRPVLFGPESILELSNIESRDNQSFIAIDGNDVFNLQKNDIVQITVSKKTLSLVRKKNDSFLKTLHKKLTDKEGL